MAFSVISEPSYLQPACSHLTHVVYETLWATRVDFKYVFDLYVNSVLVNTTKLYPLVDGKCRYNPSKMIRDYVSTVYNPALASIATGSAGEVCEYYVVFKEEYVVSGAETTYTMSTGSTKYAWNASAPYEQSHDVYALFVAPKVPAGASSADFLNFKYTGTATRGIPICENEYRTASFVYKNAAGTPFLTTVKVTTTCVDGSNKVYSYTNALVTANDAVSRIAHFPVGVPQINTFAWTSTSIPAGMSAQVNVSEDVSYTVEFTSATGDVYKTLYFDLLSSASEKHGASAIAYASSGGGFGYLPVYARKGESVTVAKSTHRRILPKSAAYEREHVVYRNQAQRVNTVNTDWLFAQSQIDEAVDCLSSHEAYLVTGAVSVPVTVEDGTYLVGSKKYDKMVQYAISLKRAYDDTLAI